MLIKMRLIDSVDNLSAAVYEKCFTNSKWVRLYDLEILNPNHNRSFYLYQKIHAIYPSLEKAIFYNYITNNIIGFCHFLEEDTAARRYLLLGGVDPDCLSTGYGAMLLYLSLNHLFMFRRANKVTCHVYDFNSASYNLLESAGFHLQGILKSHAVDFSNNTLIDVRSYCMLSSEFLNSRIAKIFARRYKKHGNTNDIY
jgi:RimJ/RimL family protein N-acetyltransferase